MDANDPRFRKQSDVSLEAVNNGGSRFQEE